MCKDRTLEVPLSIPYLIFPCDRWAFPTLTPLPRNDGPSPPKFKWATGNLALREMFQDLETLRARARRVFT